MFRVGAVAAAVCLLASCSSSGGDTDSAHDAAKRALATHCAARADLAKALGGTVSSGHRNISAPQTIECLYGSAQDKVYAFVSVTVGVRSDAVHRIATTVAGRAVRKVSGIGDEAYATPAPRRQLIVGVGDRALTVTTLPDDEPTEVAVARLFL